MGNEEYGPPPTGEPIGYGARPQIPFAQIPAPPGTPPVAGYSPAYPAAYPPPYPPPAGGARPDKNWLGIASLVLGLLGGGLLGAIFGGLGISAANEGRATNKKMAIWGLVLNLALPALFLGLYLTVGLAAGGLADDQVPYNEVAVGECVKAPAGWNGGGEDYEVRYFTRVDCDQEHWGQVYHREPLRGDDYPGDDDLVALSEEVCYSERAMAKIAPKHFDEAYVYSFYPTEESWDGFDRAAICFVFDEDHALTESWVVAP